ncbi:MAG: Uncharacterized protein FD149_671 [Rhodospirillaceae bacterium]|nr:MAG: Uncharacterized protein FD149_671 [Rhodospirillaceae bacterium]
MDHADAQEIIAAIKQCMVDLGCTPSPPAAEMLCEPQEQNENSMEKSDKQDIMELITLFMTRMNTRIDRLDAGMTELKTGMAELKAEVSALKAEVAALEKRLIRVEGRLEEQSRIIASLIPATIAAVPGKTAAPERWKP